MCSNSKEIMILLENAIKAIVNVCIVNVKSQKNKMMAYSNQVQVTGTALICQKRKNHLKEQYYTVT